MSVGSIQFYLQGRILDPNGAAATAAVVTLIDQTTSVTRSTVSNQQGEYNFASVQPSLYTVSVESSGFKRFGQAGVSIATQATATFDIKLEIGQVSEQINVAEDAPPLQTGDCFHRASDRFQKSLITYFTVHLSISSFCEYYVSL